MFIPTQHRYVRMWKRLQEPHVTRVELIVGREFMLGHRLCISAGHQPTARFSLLALHSAATTTCTNVQYVSMPKFAPFCLFSPHLPRWSRFQNLRCFCNASMTELSTSCNERSSRMFTHPMMRSIACRKAVASDIVFQKDSNSIQCTQPPPHVG